MQHGKISVPMVGELFCSEKAMRVKLLITLVKIVEIDLTEIPLQDTIYRETV